MQSSAPTSPRGAVFNGHPQNAGPDVPRVTFLGISSRNSSKAIARQPRRSCRPGDPWASARAELEMKRGGLQAALKRTSKLHHPKPHDCHSLLQVKSPNLLGFYNTVKCPGHLQGSLSVPLKSGWQRCLISTRKYLWPSLTCLDRLGRRKTTPDDPRA